MKARTCLLCLALSAAAPAASLRELADARGILIGAAVDPALLDDKTYAETLAREFNTVVAENVMKFGPTRPTRETYNFAPADRLVEFAQAHNMKVRGHTFVWHQMTPRWLTTGTFSSDEVAAILRDHIHTVMAHFKGKVFAWDVVNEATDNDAPHGPRKTFWLEKLGPDYIDKAFRWAHEADPGAKLFYNDYDADGMNVKSDAVYNLVKGLKSRGVPVHGVGLQMHLSLKSAPTAAQLAANIRRLAALGLEVHITEMDVRLAVPPTPEDLEAQAKVYATIAGTCAGTPGCKALLTWGVNDAHSWIPGFHRGFGAALLFDQQSQPKPARRAIEEALRPAAQIAAASGRYQPNWESIDSRPSPGWFTDSKFGIFIHWGVYSVPSYAPLHSKGETMYAEWYWNSLNKGANSSTKKFHDRVYGPNFPYFDFAPMFKAELYDPDHWADVFQRSGAKYVALTSKHHEGFTLWKNADANRTWGRPWNAVDVGPKRDIALDLMEAGRRKGLHMGIYYSLYEWYNPLWLSDKKRYVTEHMFPQFKDAVTHLKPSIIFSDGEWELPSADWRSPELLAWLFNESPVRDEVVIDDRWGKDTRHKHGGYYTTEYTSGMQQAAHPWEESRGMGYSYGYNRNENAGDYRTDRELLMMLIDIVSRGGNLLLDIGPTADGRIPVIMEERLLQIGDFLRPNGEAIYGTHAHRVSRQWSQGTVPKLEVKEYMSDYPISSLVDTPPAGNARVDAFFTAKTGAVYAILPRRPIGEIVLNDIEAAGAVKVSLLEGGQMLDSTLQGKQLRVRVPAALAASLPARQAYVLKLAGAK